MSNRLDVWETKLTRIGIFVLFVVTYSDYIFHTVWAIIGPLFQR